MEFTTDKTVQSGKTFWLTGEFAYRLGMATPPPSLWQRARGMVCSSGICRQTLLPFEGVRLSLQTQL